MCVCVCLYIYIYIIFVVHISFVFLGGFLLELSGFFRASVRCHCSGFGSGLGSFGAFGSRFELSKLPHAAGSAAQPEACLILNPRPLK